MLSAEELELLSTEPELQSLVAALREKRAAEVAAEDAERARQDALDAAAEAPLAALRERGRPWREWSAAWEFMKELEVSRRETLERRARLLLAEEEREAAARSKVAGAFDASLAELKRLEAAKRRYLLDSAAWCDDWLAAWEGEWRKWRDEADARVHEALFGYPERRAADEAEIAALERRVAELEKRGA